MLVGAVPAPLDAVAVLIERRATDDVGIEMELVKVDRDQLAKGVIPRPLPDPLARRDAALALLLRAQVSAPCPFRRAGVARELGAPGVRPLQPAKVAAVARPDAGDEKAHGLIPGLGERKAGGEKQCGSGERFQQRHDQILSIQARRTRVRGPHGAPVN